MTTRTLKACGARSGLAVAVCLPFLALSPSDAEAREASRFLELESEVSVATFGVRLDIAAGPQGSLFLSSESHGGIWRLAEDGATWVSLLPGSPGRDVPRHPASIEADIDGNLWVADPDRHRVVVLGPSGEVVRVHDDSRSRLRKPTKLSRLDKGRMTVWDAATRVSLQLPGGDEPLVLGHPGIADANNCVPVDSTSGYCVGTDRQTLVKYAEGRTIGTWTPSGPYARLGDLVATPGGDVYLTDTAGRRLFAVAADLKSAIRFRLYESLFQSPTRLAVTSDQLWLVDEGRQTVMRFRVRTAETAWEHALLGEEYLALSLHEAALGELKRAEELGLRHPELPLHVGIALYGLGRYDDALAAWDPTPHSPREQTARRFWRANALFRLGRYREAAGAYESISAEETRYAYARFNLAQTYLALGENESARAELAALLSVQPENDFARVSLARALIGLARNQEARTLLLEVVSEQGPAAKQARLHLGRLYLAADDARAALPMLERAAKEGPYYRAALRALAEAHRDLGDLERARFYEQRAQSLRDDARALGAFLLEDQS